MTSPRSTARRPTLADILNQIGLIVEGVSAPGAEVGGVTTAKVLAVEPHPDADRLMLVDVDHGDGEIRESCAAPATTPPGDVVPWAGPGATLPGGFKIEKRKIRGQVSNGMLCSSRELGVSDDHAGILILPPGTAVGLDIRDVLGIDDVIFDLEITPNRPDAMSVAGRGPRPGRRPGRAVHARPPRRGRAPAGTRRRRATLVVEAADRCPRYVARDRHASPSARRPTGWPSASSRPGMRPISNVVDVTNYVMLERGQPLHAFDLGLLAARGIVVRIARDGERIITLDDVDRDPVAPTTCSSATPTDGPQAVAGVMGGGGSEVSRRPPPRCCSSRPTSCPRASCRTSKRLGPADRVERPLRAGRRPQRRGAGRRPGHGAVRRGGRRPGRRRRPRRLPGARSTAGPGHPPAGPGQRRPGHRPPGRPGAAPILEPLGMTVDAAGHGVLRRRPSPPTGPTSTREIDLVEEVARHHGYNNIPRTAAPHGRAGRRRSPPSSGPAGRPPGAGRARGSTRPPPSRCLAAADLAAAGLGRPASSWRTRCGPRSRCCGPPSCPVCCGPAAFNAGHGHPDVGPVRDRPRVPAAARAGRSSPTSGSTSPSSLAGAVRRRPHEADRPVDGHDAVGHLGAGRRGARPGRLVRLTPADRPAFARGRAAAVHRRRRRRRHGRRGRPGRRRPPRPDRHGGRLRGEPRRGSTAGHPARPADQDPVPVPGLVDRPGLRGRRHRRRRRRRADPAVGRRRTAARASGLFDVFRSDALGATGRASPSPSASGRPTAP